MNVCQGKRHKKKVVALFLTIFVLVACDAKINISNRSGSLDDDYVAEPLSGRSKKYENALNVSNDVIDKIISRNFDSIYSDIFDAQLKSDLDKKKFTSSIAKLESVFGNIKEYKKLQWGFFSGEEDGRKFLYSKKIVEYEKGMVKYLFVFNDDGKYRRIVGLHVEERKGVTPPGVF